MVPTSTIQIDVSSALNITNLSMYNLKLNTNQDIKGDKTVYDSTVYTTEYNILNISVTDITLTNK